MPDRIIYSLCPLCDSPRFEHHVDANCSGHGLYVASLSPHMRWLRCTSCEHVFTEGYYTDTACALIYSRTNSNQIVGNDLEGQRYVSSRIVEKIVPHAAGGRWLDVGFGNGSLLLTAQEYGFEPVGLDLRPQTAQALQSLGVPAFCSDITLYSPGNRFNVISMADVIEHMPFPKQGLEAAHRLLGDDGILFLSMPNSESAVWRDLDARNTNPYWGELEHYHNFSRSRLYLLLATFGFEPIRYGISERYRACMEVVARKL